MKKLKEFLNNIIYKGTLECIEGDLKVGAIYHFTYNDKQMTKEVNLSNVPRKGDYINMYIINSLKQYQVEKVVFEMYGGVVNIFLK